MRLTAHFLMENIKETLKNKSSKYNNVNNDIINNITNNVNNGVSSKYSLNKDKFIPNTEETQLAEEIATYLGDLQNYALYLHIVKKLGISGAYSFLKSVQEEIENKRGTKFQIKSPKKYFTWKFKKGLY